MRLQFCSRPRRSNSTGNLLDDVELIEVLANTKAKAKEVEQKLADAAEKQTEIAEKREQYRPVATRGSVMSRKTVCGRLLDERVRGGEQLVQFQ